MKRLFLLSLISASFGIGVQAQICNPAVAPTGLVSTYTPGTGVLLEWNAVPGSIGVQIRVELPSGSTINRRIVSFERDQYAVPDALLTSGTYVWRVQAACSYTPPYDVTPLSVSNTFVVGGGGACPATVTDIDGNVYPTVEIDGQCWTQSNLQVEHYRNGDVIPTGLSNSAWLGTTSGAYASYDNNPANQAIYGSLYNWYAVADPRGLCPTGWHVSTDTEWTDLIAFLGGTAIAGGKLKTTGTVSAGTGLWEAPNTAATNSSGFSGVPGGYRLYDGNYFNLRFQGHFWSSTEVPPFNAYKQRLDFLSGQSFRTSNDKPDGYSVRCVKD